MNLILLWQHLLCMHRYRMMTTRYLRQQYEIANSKMIIVDKNMDSTVLEDCTSSLQVWCRDMTNHIRRSCVAVRISPHQTEFIITKFHTAIGWDASSNDIIPNATLQLAAMSWNDIIGITYNVLIETRRWAPPNSPGLEVQLSEVKDWHNSILQDVLMSKCADESPIREDMMQFQFE